MIEDGSSALFVLGEREWGEVVKCTFLQVIKFNIGVNLVLCIDDVHMVTTRDRTENF